MLDHHSAKTNKSGEQVVHVSQSKNRTAASPPVSADAALGPKVMSELPMPVAPSFILQMQKTVGNRSAAQLLKSSVAFGQLAKFNIPKPPVQMKNGAYVKHIASSRSQPTPIQLKWEEKDGYSVWDELYPDGTRWYELENGNMYFELEEPNLHDPMDLSYEQLKGEVNARSREAWLAMDLNWAQDIEVDMKLDLKETPKKADAKKDTNIGKGKRSSSGKSKGKGQAGKESKGAGGAVTAAATGPSAAIMALIPGNLRNLRELGIELESLVQESVLDDSSATAVIMFAMYTDGDEKGVSLASAINKFCAENGGEIEGLKKALQTLARLKGEDKKSDKDHDKKGSAEDTIINEDECRISRSLHVKISKLIKSISGNPLHKENDSIVVLNLYQLISDSGAADSEILSKWIRTNKPRQKVEGLLSIVNNVLTIGECNTASKRMLEACWKLYKAK
jgi:hypothetical protein